MFYFIIYLLINHFQVRPRASNVDNCSLSVDHLGPNSIKKKIVILNVYNMHLSAVRCSQYCGDGGTECLL